MLRKYRFRTKSVSDYRPLIDMKEIGMPWWCSGTSADDSYAIIICYLPETESLYKYWDDAYYVEFEEVEEIQYTSRFPKPKWLEGVSNE